MKKRISLRGAAISAYLGLAAELARAGGDSGTSSVNELNVSGGQFLMLVGGVVVLGVVIWFVVKLMNK